MIAQGTIIKSSMRRLVFNAAFALLLCVPVWAQRGGHFGGGHFGGGMRGGFAGRSGGFMAGGRAFGGRSFGGMRSPGMSRSGPGFSRGFNRSFNRGFGRGGFRGPFRGGFRHRGFRGFRDRDFDDFGFRNGCYGYGCWGGWGVGWGYPWWGGYADYYEPWWWQQDDQQFDEDYYRQYELANEMNQQSLEQQQMLRQEQAEGDQDAYAPRSYNRPAPQSYSGPAPQPGSGSQLDDAAAPTVLVYRDQHRQEIENYAIVGQTLWAFSAGRTQKIALANLDLSATEKINDDHGVTFSVPGASPGQ